jgi:hypothetical protein
MKNINFESWTKKGRGYNALNPTFWLDDRVTGYNIGQIETSMRKSPTWADWENNMRNDHTNATEGFLDELF